MKTKEKLEEEILKNVKELEDLVYDKTFWEVRDVLPFHDTCLSEDTDERYDFLYKNLNGTYHRHGGVDYVICEDEETGAVVFYYFDNKSFVYENADKLKEIWG